MNLATLLDFTVVCFVEHFNSPVLKLRKNGIKCHFYPDFILTLQENDPKSFDKIFLIETKGGHLLGNADTEYKRELTRLYQRAVQKSWSSNEAFPSEPKETIFKFVEEQNLENAMNEIFAS